MILHGLRVENWRNIQRIELSHLDHPFVVLHGPNRTGKSSLATALRCCLFDCDHDSQRAMVKNSIPWGTKLIPEVAVDFSHDSRRYRLTKKFSRGKEGGATLERGDGDDWSVIEKGKEAGRQVRALLDAEHSEQSVYQLLWLKQGDVHLPDSDKLSPQLDRRMQDVLGSLLTAHDWSFHHTLKQAWDCYFTPKGFPKKSAPVAQLTEQLAACDERVAALKKRSVDGDHWIRELESRSADAEEEQRRIDIAREEIAALESQADAVKDRQVEHRQACAEWESAKNRLAEREAEREQFQSQRSRLAELEREIIKSEAQTEVAESTCESVAQAIAELNTRREVIRQQRAAAESRSQEIADKTKLIEIDEQCRRLRTSAEKLAAAEEKVQSLERELAAITVPSDADITKLKQHQRRIQELQATLDAGALSMEVTPESTGRFRLTKDQSNPEEHAAPVTQTFHQFAELDIPGWGHIRVSRGAADLSLDDTARELARLRQAVTSLLESHGLSPSQPDAVEQLIIRRTRREELQTQHEEWMARRNELAPHGQAELDAQTERVHRDRDALLQRSPTLAGWTSDPESLAVERRQLEEETKVIGRELGDWESRREQFEQQRRAADEKLQAAKTRTAELRARREMTESRLAEFGDEHTLQSRVKQAAADCEAAAGKMRHASLTDDEQRLGDRLQEARTALDRRLERLAEQRDAVQQFRGRLQSLEGIHDDLTTAEIEQNLLQEELHRHSLNADAHHLLLSTFESCRDVQVDATTGQIGKQVIEWTRRLGLGEYEHAEFEKGYLPDKLRTTTAEQSVPLGEESFGTAEQLALLIRLAVGRLIVGAGRHAALLDDPLTHADPTKHRRMLEIFQEIATPHPASAESDAQVSPLQLLIFTCHPERFDHLKDAKHINLATAIRQGELG